MADENTETVTADQTTVADGADKTQTVTDGADKGTQTKDVGDTVLDTAVTDDKDTAAPADFPQDWREKMSGDDKKFLNVLKRYSSPQTFAKAYQSLRQKQDSGELRAPLPKDATPEQVAAYRKDSGIPDKPEGYDLGGLAISDEDKPAVDEYLKTMHAQNATPDQIKANLGVYYKLKADAETALAENDAKIKHESEDALRSEFGADYRRNMMGAHNLLESMPEGLKDNLMGARLKDGTKFGDNATALKWLVQTALELNPAATVVMGVGDSSVKSIATEIAAIEKTMREDRPAYDKDGAMRARYRELIEAREKLSKRQAA
jgi:hypothetical protein